MSDVKYLSINEFQEKGLLFEANRQFFHPLGLALEIQFDDEGKAFLSGIWDYRDDPEGITYANSIMSSDATHEKAEYVRNLRLSKEKVRENMFGSVIQPLKS